MRTGATPIRGFGLFGCGTAMVSAERRSSRVQVAIRALNADRPCVANIPAWRPYRVEILALEPGRYDMTVTAIGHAHGVSSSSVITWLSLARGSVTFIVAGLVWQRTSDRVRAASVVLMVVGAALVMMNLWSLM